MLSCDDPKPQKGGHMKARYSGVLAHHQPAATMWGRGGKDYDLVRPKR